MSIAIYLNIVKNCSVEIPDLTSLPEVHDEPVFDEYHKDAAAVAGAKPPRTL